MFFQRTTFFQWRSVVIIFSRYSSEFFQLFDNSRQFSKWAFSTNRSYLQVKTLPIHIAWVWFNLLYCARWCETAFQKDFVHGSCILIRVCVAICNELLPLQLKQSLFNAFSEREEEKALLSQVIRPGRWITMNISWAISEQSLSSYCSVWPQWQYDLLSYVFSCWLPFLWLYSVCHDCFHQKSMLSHFSAQQKDIKFHVK